MLGLNKNIAQKMTMQLTHWSQRYVYWLSSGHHHHGLIAIKEGLNNYDLKHTFPSVLLCLAVLCSFFY